MSKQILSTTHSIDILDANARAIIAFSLAIIALILVYLAFFK
jgi:hypothetical protein